MCSRSSKHFHVQSDQSVGRTDTGAESMIPGLLWYPSPHCPSRSWWSSAGAERAPRPTESASGRSLPNPDALDFGCRSVWRLVARYVTPEPRTVVPRNEGDCDDIVHRRSSLASQATDNSRARALHIRAIQRLAASTPASEFRICPSAQRAVAWAILGSKEGPGVLRGDVRRAGGSEVL